MGDYSGDRGILSRSNVCVIGDRIIQFNPLKNWMNIVNKGMTSYLMTEIPAIYFISDRDPSAVVISQSTGANRH